MGTGDRRFQTKQRSDLFKKYYEDNDYAVRLVRIGLTEVKQGNLKESILLNLILVGIKQRAENVLIEAM